MTAFHQVERFIEQSQRATTPRELDRLLGDITGEMGFDYYALVHHVDLTPHSSDLSHMAHGDLVALTNYPETWIEAYISRNIVSSDPVHLASHRTNVGFRWDEVDRLISVTAEHRTIREETIRAGIEEGYTVPANVPGEANGSCSFAMRCGVPLPEQNLAMAQLVGSFAFAAARKMVMNSRAAQPTAATQTPTPRQLDCVILVARGKTDWEIGQILGLHEQTVTDHLDEARRRCGVDRRAQLVVHALYNGYLTFADVLESKWR